MDRPTHSPHWHRVRATKPRLRPHVQITRQRYRGRRWHVAHDPASNRFFRLGAVGHEFVGLLDGVRTVEEAWSIVAERHGDRAPTQPELIELISQLYNANLLSVEATPETEQLLRRARDRVVKKAQGQLLGLMYFRVKLFNPDAIISAVEPVLRPILNRWGLLAWLGLVVFALSRLAPEWERLRNGFEDAIAPSNWAWLAVVFVVAKALHELGHGVICKRFGGQVPEFGIMLLVLVPSPYVDASACWGFSSRWRRIAVGAGGMLFELALASAAALVWIGGTPGELSTQLAFNAMLTAGVSTILFNANPLMRFDGYYILSDLLEIPNLMSRSFKMLQYHMQQFVYRVERAEPPTTDAGEGAALTAYGLGALAYRIFLFITITVFVMGKLFAIGLFLAIWTAAAWFIKPVWSFVKWLSSSPMLAEQRGRAVVTSLALFVGVAVVLGLIPMPDVRRGVGVVESTQRSGVFANGEGFLTLAAVKTGERVEAGALIATIDNDELRQRLRLSEAVLAEIESMERQMTAENPSSVEIARERVRAQRRAVVYLREQVDRLAVRAPHDGVFVASQGSMVVGSAVAEGTVLGEVIDLEGVRVSASMDQLESAWLFDTTEPYTVRLRPVSDPGTEVAGVSSEAIDGGQFMLPHAGLGVAGGGRIATDVRRGNGRITERPRFTVYVDPAPSERWRPTPGERVHLRFDLSRKPLMVQWVDRLHKLVQGRIRL
ncbi:MAG: PqqD family peptide modification chaperone [Planctomycetota bacterium]